MNNIYTIVAKEILRTARTKPVCIDVGSAGGFHHRLEAVRSEIEIIGFDADPGECEKLNARVAEGERHINAAIGRDNEKITLELHKKRKTSSCYKTDTGRIRYFADAARLDPDGEISFTTRSLDSVCASEHISRIDYIKVDVEGHELAVLEGCGKQYLMAEVEVGYHPFRQGACSFDQIMKHMRERGYILLDLRRTYWSPSCAGLLRNYGAKGFLIFGDALFCLDPFLESNHAALASVDARARYLALLCLYGYTAETLMVIDLLQDKRVMPSREADKLKTIIMGSAARKVKLRLGRLLLMLERWFQFPVAVRSGFFLGEHAQGDGELGNQD